jgi:hypothetical protein
MNCCICFDDNIDSNSICFTNCNHSYCKSCLDKWFDKGTNTCPLCRSEIKYFRCNNENNRIITLNYNINNFREDIIVYINKLKIQIFLFKLFFFIMIGTTIYIKINCVDDIDLLTEKYEDCNHNNTILTNYFKNNKKYTLMLYNSEYLQCMVPYPIISECIENNK